MSTSKAMKLSGIRLLIIFIARYPIEPESIYIKVFLKENLISQVFRISKRFIKSAVIDVKIIATPYPYMFKEGMLVRINTSINPSEETMIEFFRLTFCFPKAFNIPKDADEA
jgi:hypothetical protein